MNDGVVLTNKNFYLFAAKNYDMSQCVDSAEFLDDLKRIKYIKKLITSFCQGKELKTRLILNHLVVLNNMFDTKALIRMLILRMEKNLAEIVPFMMYLNICPNSIDGIRLDEVRLNNSVVKALRELK